MHGRTRQDPEKAGEDRTKVGAAWLSPPFAVIADHQAPLLVLLLRDINMLHSRSCVFTFFI